MFGALLCLKGDIIMAELVITKGNPVHMGASKQGKAYNFAYCSKASSVSLLIIGSDGSVVHRFELDESYKTGDVFAVSLSGANLDKCFYCYEVDKVRRLDPYSKTVTGCEQFGIREEQMHASRIVLDKFDWGDDRPLEIPYEDCVFYKMHVRGFTKSRTSGVKAKGTFKGITEKLDYLKNLGITTIELMPCYEFDECVRFPELLQTEQGDYRTRLSISRPVNYWGYCSGFHFAPKASFSSSARNKSDYTTEFKNLVKLLHSNGIEVVMEMFFDRETPDMILDCARFWVSEYHIDGIHMYGPQTALELLASDPMLSHTKIVTVYWDKAKGSMRNMASYNNDYANVVRKLLKGDENQLESFMGMSRKNPDNSAVINYITNHNGFTLADLVSYDRKHNEHNGENNLDGENFNYSWNCGVEGKSRKKKIVELRQRQMKNAFMMLMFSAGTPLILAGDEFENSQGGNNNPYCIDGETTWLNWKGSSEANDLERFVRKLIRYRLGNKILHMEKQLYASDSKSCGYPDISYHGSAAWYQVMENYNRHIGIMYCTNYDGDAHDDGYELIYVGFNMHFEEHQLALPKLPDNVQWEQKMSSCEHDLEIDDGKYVTIPPRTTVVLRAKLEHDNGKDKENSDRKLKYGRR